MSRQHLSSFSQSVHRVVLPAFWLLLSLLILATACSDSGDEQDRDDAVDGDSDSASNEADALQTGQSVRRTISHTALQVQDLLYIFFGCHSYGFTEPLFARSYAQMESDPAFWNTCYDDMVASLTRIEESGQDLESALDELGLLEDAAQARRARGVLASFFGLFTATSEMKERQRNLFIQVTDDLPANEKTAVYETASIKCPEDIPDCNKSEADFYKLMREGKLDHAVLQMHSQCSQSSDTDLWGYQGEMENRKNRPLDVAAKEIPKVAAEGAKLAVAAGQTATAGVSLLREAVGGAVQAWEMTDTADATASAAEAENASLPEYIENNLTENGLADESASEVADMAAALNMALTDVVVDAAIAQGAKAAKEAILGAGYSQIQVMPDDAHDLEGNLEKSLVVVTSDDLFTAGRVIIGSADAENAPLLVPPGEYDVAATVEGEVAKVENVKAEAGKLVQIALEAQLWKSFGPSSGGDDPDPIDGDSASMPGSAQACAHFTSAYGEDGSCYTNMDFFTYCAEEGPYYCSCVPYEGSGDGEWTVFPCQDACLNSGLGIATDCDNSSERKQLYNEYYDLMQETAGPGVTMLDQCVCSDEFIAEEGEICKWATDYNQNLAGKCADVLDLQRDRWMTMNEFVCVGKVEYRCQGIREGFNSWTSMKTTSCDDSDPTTFDSCDLDCEMNTGCVNVPVSGFDEYHKDCSEADSGKTRCEDTGQTGTRMGLPLTVRVRCDYDAENERYRENYVEAIACEPSETYGSER